MRRAQRCVRVARDERKSRDRWLSHPMEAGAGKHVRMLAFPVEPALQAAAFLQARVMKLPVA